VLPKLQISGLLFGSRVFEVIGTIIFKDEKNDLHCALKFYEPPGFFSRAEHSSDHFDGLLTKISNMDKIISKVSGEWTDHIQFDGKKYWDLKLIDPVIHIHTLEPLPSDCRFREDLIYLAKKDMQKAQENKIRLEVL